MLEQPAERTPGHTGGFFGMSIADGTKTCDRSTSPLIPMTCAFDEYWCAAIPFHGFGNLPTGYSFPSLRPNAASHNAPGAALNPHASRHHPAPYISGRAPTSRRTMPAVSLIQRPTLTLGLPYSQSRHGRRARPGFLGSAVQVRKYPPA